ncbi:hypothetical protein [Streptomyces exfoliatus]|uniref:hypothetical protein n=1 Tax=Streptomyces exfoliatus TaxID=1905 RepID=UPI0004662B0D|nr:hypothetical protein [Streptomyces exfoliatus]
MRTSGPSAWRSCGEGATTTPRAVPATHAGHWTAVAPKPGAEGLTGCGDVRRHRQGAFRGLLWPVLDALTEGEPPPAEEWNELRRVILPARESAALPAVFPLRRQPGNRDRARRHYARSKQAR